jgi:hypothetical protein
VEFIDDGAGEGWGFERGVGPVKGGVIEEAGRAVDAFGLPGGTGIGEGEGLIVEEEDVVHAGVGRVDVGLPPASVVLLERVLLLGYLDAYFLGFGGPEVKAMHSGSALFQRL